MYKVILSFILLFVLVSTTPAALAGEEVSSPYIPPIDSNSPTLPADPADPIIDFPDPTFKSFADQFLEKDSDDLIHQSDIDHACPKSDASLREFRIENFKEGATKIKSIEGIQSLKQCNIYIFELRYQEIADITPLSDLTSLVTLSLENNQIQSLDPLANLVNLKVLYIQNNNVSSLKPLENLSLNSLNASYNNITDISELSNSKDMRSLSVNNNQISSISVVSQFTSLSTLNVSNNKIADIEPVKEVVELRRLYVGDNYIADLLPLKDLIKLELLNLNNIHLFDDTGLAPISLLPQLTSLYLAGNSIESLTSLMNLSQLTFLNLSNNDLQDVSPIADFTELETLDLSSNQIEDLSSLAGLLNLRQLVASNNRITNLQTIQQLKLKKVTLNDNKIDVTSDINKPAIAYWQALGEVEIADQDLSQAEPSSQDKIKFVDIIGHWAEHDINWAFENKMVSGTSPGIFSPNKTITEVEFLKILLIAMNVITEDPPSTPWYQKYVDLALAYNYPIHPDHPNERITRSDVAELISATQGKKLQGDAAIQYLLENRLSAGKTEATVEGYKGLDYLTRAEAVRFIRNVLSEAEYSTAQPLS